MPASILEGYGMHTNFGDREQRDNEELRNLSMPASDRDDSPYHRMELNRWEDEGGRCYDDRPDCDIEPPAAQEVPPGVAREIVPEAPRLSQPTQAQPLDSEEEPLSSDRTARADGARPIPTTFEEFWPEYLEAHSKRATRVVHLAAPPAALVFAGACVALGNPLLALAAPVVAYGPIFLSHWLIEGNHPKTFGNPVWSLRAEAKLLYLGMAGRLGAELEKHGIVPQTEEWAIWKAVKGLFRKD